MQRNCLNLASLVGGKPVAGAAELAVKNPYNGLLVGTVRQASREDVDSAIAQARSFSALPTRHQRAEILETTRAAIQTRSEEFARLITSEAGLALQEARYEVGRALDVLR